MSNSNSPKKNERKKEKKSKEIPLRNERKKTKRIKKINKTQRENLDSRANKHFV